MGIDRRIRPAPTSTALKQEPITLQAASIRIGAKLVYFIKLSFYSGVGGQNWGAVATS